jgi:hypothetical protein
MNIFNSVFSGSGQVSVNGKIYKGKNICIQNDQVIIDGVVQDDKQLVGPITINISGNAEIIESYGGNVTAETVGDISSGSGNIRCGNVSGSVKNDSGNVTCKSIHGMVRTGSGDVYE